MKGPGLILALLVGTSMGAFTARASDFTGYYRGKLALEILTLNAVTNMATYSAEVGAEWARPDKHPGDQNPFDYASGNAANLASGRDAFHEATWYAAEAVSARGHFQFVPFSTTDGKEVAEITAYQYEIKDRFDRCIAAARDALTSGGGAQEVGLAAASAGWRVMLFYEVAVRAKIRNQMTFDLFNYHADWVKVYELLRAPIDSGALGDALPEARDYYIEHVTKIEAEMLRLELI